MLVNEASGSAEFAKASRIAVEKWKYKPAFENGKPVQQCVNSVQMDSTHLLNFDDLFTCKTTINLMV